MIKCDIHRIFSHIITRRAKICLYQSLVLPVLESGSVLYDNCTTVLKNRVEQIQRRAAVSCTGAFRITSYSKLLDELGWNSLDDRRAMARRILLYKMNHNLVPDYLSDLVPQTVGARVGNYVLRNSGDFTCIKTRKSQFYNSFLPKTIREWNNSESAWRGLDFAPSVDSFKSNYKKLLHRTSNLLYNIELEKGNIHHSRLRLGLSHLRAHLFQYNLIDDPVCQFCNVEIETTGHYVLRCPSFHAARTNYLLGIIANLDQDYVQALNDDKILDIFLYGDVELDNQVNEVLFTMALTFINSSKRFDMRIVQQVAQRLGAVQVANPFFLVYSLQ